MSRTWYLRRAAGLLAIAFAIACVVETASPTDSSANPYCPPRTVCLYPDANFHGKQRRYGCQGWAPGSYRSADLRRLFPWGTKAGVSSYQNNGVPQAILQTEDTKGPGSDQLTLGRHGNIAREYNDEATDLYVRC